MSEPSYPGAVPPERSRWLESFGLRLRVHEWGDPEGTPVVLIHGMFDHARTFDVFAPLLAERFRVVAMDARGHGDSEWATSYPWVIDVLTIIQLLRSNGRPSHLIGHSKGGAQSTDAAARAPDDILRLVNIDGFGPPEGGFGPGGTARPQRTPPEYLGDFFDWRRNSSKRSGWRAFPSIDELVQRRQPQNPRLSSEWLRYFASYGAFESERGFTWKSDPHSVRGFGPFQPDWIAHGWKPLRTPMLAVTGNEDDTWGPIPETLIQERLRFVSDVERISIDGTGHFVHIERPEETARVLLDWLGD
jgi:pimeloyl-ACP methyl ester carboxylesterase